ncbi:MAG TPA: helix-turn-helix domain-containing protein [Acidimicrobiales bacterium]|nr:helix-turn-helix domain-containing protein [Acidimicrobiales bacterium]
MRQEAELPDILTVEEAAALLRIGRTKAYATAKQWRATGGRTGLPVVDFGSVPRVPRVALESRLGVGLTRPPVAPARPSTEVEVANVAVAAESRRAASAKTRPRRGGGRAKVDPGQLSLFSVAQSPESADSSSATNTNTPSRPVNA